MKATPESAPVARFGHHPDPATDFCLEFEAIEGEVFNQAAGMPPEFDIRQRVTAAMNFNVGGEPAAVVAKQALRLIDAALLAQPSAAPPAPGGDVQMLITLVRKLPASWDGRYDKALKRFEAALFATLQSTQAPTAAAQGQTPSADIFANAIRVDWNMEPHTPDEALELLDAMDAEHAKTMGKPAPDAEMAHSMKRVRHMACDLWASQKDEIRAAFVALKNAAQGQDAAPAEQPQAVELLDERGEIRRDLKGSAYCVGNEYKPFHPSASHVRPEWRDGWNACFVAAIAQESKAP